MDTSIPLPGQHLRNPEQEFADPDAVRAEVEELLAILDEPDTASDGDTIPHRARVLEQAHDVLVRALARVDKI